MNTNLRGALVVGIVCALTAGGAAAAHARGAPDPCALLTPAQVGGTLGNGVGAGAPIGTTGCQWTVASDPSLRATLTVSSADQWAMMKTPLPNITKTAASGIGDDAFFTTVGTLTTLSVKKGTTVIVVHIYGVPDQARQQAMRRRWRWMPSPGSAGGGGGD